MAVHKCNLCFQYSLTKQNCVSNACCLGFVQGDLLLDRERELHSSLEWCHHTSIYLSLSTLAGEQSERAPSFVQAAFLLLSLNLSALRQCHVCHVPHLHISNYQTILLLHTPFLIPSHTSYHTTTTLFLYWTYSMPKAGCGCRLLTEAKTRHDVHVIFLFFATM